MTNDKKILNSLIIPFGMSPADEVEAINAALQERGLDASNVVSVRATGTPRSAIIVYFTELREEDRPHPSHQIVREGFLE